jgi:hypothetical protein
LAIFGNFWQFLAIFGNFWQFLAILAIFGNFWQFRQFLAVWRFQGSLETNLQISFFSNVIFIQIISISFLFGWSSIFDMIEQDDRAKSINQSFVTVQWTSHQQRKQKIRVRIPVVLGKTRHCCCVYIIDLMFTVLCEIRVLSKNIFKLCDNLKKKMKNLSKKKTHP